MLEDGSSYLTAESHSYRSAIDRIGKGDDSGLPKGPA